MLRIFIISLLMSLPLLASQLHTQGPLPIHHCVIPTTIQFTELPQHAILNQQGRDHINIRIFTTEPLEDCNKQSWEEILKCNKSLKALLFSINKQKMACLYRFTKKYPVVHSFNDEIKHIEMLGNYTEAILYYKNGLHKQVSITDKRKKSLMHLLSENALLYLSGKDQFKRSVFFSVEFEKSLYTANGKRIVFVTDGDESTTPSKKKNVTSPALLRSSKGKVKNPLHAIENQPFLNIPSSPIKEESCQDELIDSWEEDYSDDEAAKNNDSHAAN